MPALPNCPAPRCPRDAFLLLGDTAYCRDHYVAKGGVL